MRVATYNIRNGRALDLSSLWWTRRRALVDVIRRIDADIWAMQEVYGFQRRYLERTALPTADWESSGEGRNDRGGGEGVTVFHRRARFVVVATVTKWFGPEPNRPGSLMSGARQPRIATIVDLETVEGGRGPRVLNLHLDSESVERRTSGIRQLAEWIDGASEVPTIVMGDFNGPMTDPGYEALVACGLRSALASDSGPTSNGFGRDLAEQRQIDHVFVSAHFEVRRARIDLAAGHASDHYPVVVDLDIDSGRKRL